MGIRYEQTAQVHRFGTAVTLFTENGYTVYLTPELAERLGIALLKCSQDIHSVPKFPVSTFAPISLHEGASCPVH